MPPKCRNSLKPSYTEDALAEALNAIIDKGMSKKAASIKFGISRTTLIDKVAHKYRPGKKKGRDPFLTEEEETSIVK